EETRTGDVTRTITGNVTESIENGSVTINNNLMGKKTTEVISGNQDYVATVSGNFTENLAVTGNYSKVITASAISEVNTGAQTQVKSDENKTILGMDYETYCGVKLSLSLAVNFDLFAGQKTEIYAGPKIVDKKIYIRKSATTLDQGEAFLTDRKIGKLGYKLTIIG